MRDVKFRIYDSVSKKMLYNDWRSFRNWYNQSRGGKVVCERTNGEPDPMQFTGLKDKNGIEIYENDIVRILYTDWASKENSDKRSLEQYLIDIGVMGYVIYKNCSFKLFSIPNENTMSIHCGTHGYIEVLGNIHENPELLEK